MTPLSNISITALQAMTSGMYKDDVEINPMVEVDDGFGTVVERYPSTGVMVKGSLQEVIRIPGTPESGGTSLVVGEYLLKLPADAPLPAQPQKCQFIVNNDLTYEATNVYKDKSDRLSTSIYCYHVG